LSVPLGAARLPSGPTLLEYALEASPEPGSDVATLIAEIDADPTGVFSN